MGPKLETKRSGNVRSHLGSYKQCLKFVTQQRVHKDAVPSLSPETIATFKDVKDVISDWCRTIDTRSQRTQKILND